MGRKLHKGGVRRMEISNLLEDFNMDIPGTLTT